MKKNSWYFFFTVSRNRNYTRSRSVLLAVAVQHYTGLTSLPSLKFWQNNYWNQMSTDRLREWASSVPLGTVSLFVINTSIHVLIFLFSTPLGYYAISPARVIYQHEFYRLGTSAFVHSGILHIGMNMMSLLQLGTSMVFLCDFLLHRH